MLYGDLADKLAVLSSMANGGAFLIATREPLSHSERTASILCWRGLAGGL